MGFARGAPRAPASWARARPADGGRGGRIRRLDSMSHSRREIPTVQLPPCAWRARPIPMAFVALASRARRNASPMGIAALTLSACRARPIPVNAWGRAPCARPLAAATRARLARCATVVGAVAWLAVKGTALPAGPTRRARRSGPETRTAARPCSVTRRDSAARSAPRALQGREPTRTAAV